MAERTKDAQLKNIIIYLSVKRIILSAHSSYTSSECSFVAAAVSRCRSLEVGESSAAPKIKIKKTYINTLFRKPVYIFYLTLLEPEQGHK